MPFYPSHYCIGWNKCHDLGITICYIDLILYHAQCLRVPRQLYMAYSFFLECQCRLLCLINPIQRKFSSAKSLRTRKIDAVAHLHSKCNTTHWRPVELNTRRRKVESHFDFNEIWPVDTPRCPGSHSESMRVPIAPFHSYEVFLSTPGRRNFARADNEPCSVFKNS